MEITAVVNKVNGVGDRDWQSVRKKYQDLTSAARQKYRVALREQEKTGGGRLPPETLLTRQECLAMKSVTEVTVTGIDGGFPI